MQSNRAVIQKKNVDTLEKFSSEHIESKHIIHKVANTLLDSLKTFDQLEEKEQSIKAHKVRNLFLDTYLDQSLPVVFVEHIDFKKLIYNMLTELAEAFPINDIDPDTQLPIDPISTLPITKSDAFYTVTGHAFNINTLIDYNQIRANRYNDNLDETNGKFLLNPFTNQPFLPMDMERLIVIAVNKQINLDFLIDEPIGSQNGPAELSKRLSLKDIASIVKGDAIDQNINIATEFIYTLTDVIAFMVICDKNNEEVPLEQINNDHQLLFELWKESNINYPITKSAANAFVFCLITHNKYKTLRELIEQQIELGLGFDLNHQFKGIAAIHAAAEHGATKSMEVLLNPKYNVDINLRNAAGGTTARMAASNNNTAIVKMLADKGANLMIPGYDGAAPIHFAAENNNTELMELLFAHHVNLNQIGTILNINNLAGKTAAHHAAEENSLQTMAMLLKAGADFNIINSAGFSPFHSAAFYGSLEVMQLLLQHKDRIISNETLQNPIPIACLPAQQGHVKILELLAESKIALDLPKKNGITPLYLAVFNNHYAAADFLIKHYLENHTNIFVKHADGQSPFLFACAKQNWDIAKLFLNRIPFGDIPADDKELMGTFHKELGLSEDVFSATPSTSMTDNEFTALMNNGLFSRHEPLYQHQQLTLTPKTEAPIRQVMR